jgi:hypothetical protein
MKEPQYYIFRKLYLILFCIVAAIVPFQLLAQDDADSTGIYTDTAIVTPTGEDYQKKAGKYSDEAVFRSVPDTIVARMKKEKEFAYANDPAFWVKEKKVYRKGFWDYVFDFFGSDLVRIIFYSLLVGLIIFVLYRIIIVNDLFIFYSSKKHKKIFEENQLTELDPGIVDQKIQEAIDQKNYHAAVRYLYLKTLYTLSDKEWIQFHPEATNSEYLNQMSQHKKNREFRFLTQVYEYVSYGKFEISEQQFTLVHHNFKSFQAAI